MGVHDAPLPDTEPEILRLLGQHGESWLARLCAVKQADLDAHAANAAVAARRAEVEVLRRGCTGWPAPAAIHCAS